MDLRQLGDLPRARVAIDRALHAAEQAEDGLLVASVSATMVVQLMVQGDAADAVALALDIAHHVRCHCAEDSAGGKVVLGALHLYAAQAAAQAQDVLEAHRLLKIATEAAESIGDDREELCLIFRPTNVAIQEAGILVDLGDPSRAIERARRVQPDRLGSVNRTGYHYLHMARAYGLRGKDIDAVQSIATAHRVAPDLVRHDPIARELIRDVVRRRRRIDDQLRSLARDMSIPL